MSGETYVKRYPGGFVDLPAQTTAIDSQFLNAVEAALVRLLGEDPTDGEIGVWSAAQSRLVYQLLKNAQVDPAAAISRSKLDFGPGLVDADIAPGAAIASSKIAGLSGTAPPPGAMLLFGGISAPGGWLICDGSEISRATQAGIFGVIGTAYGAGNGTSTFNLPDFRGRMPVGVGTHGDVGALGASDGVTLASRRPKHSHTNGLTFVGSPGTTGDDSPDHSHLQISDSSSGGTIVRPAKVSGFAGTAFGTNQNTGGASARHQHGFTPAGTIGGSIGQAGVNDSPAYLAVNVIIKT